MLKLLSADLWDTIGEKAVKAKRRRAAIAYVTESRLLPLGAGDVLVVDASDASIAGGRTSAEVLAGYLTAGASLFNVPNLHAKVLVLDDWAVIGSANASQRSNNYYVEASVISDRPELIGQAEQLIGSLAASGGVIDSEFIARIRQIPVLIPPDPPSNRASSHTKVQTGAPKYWLISTREDARYPGDIEVVENTMEEVQERIGPDAGIVSWFWWGGNAPFPSTARVGDIVIQCSRPRNKMSSSRGVLVHRHGRIESIFQEPGQTVKTFHCVRPLDWEQTAVKWVDFARLAKRAGITRKLTYASNIRLTEKQSGALFEIWPT
ncbi:UNVERIFIED_ORG: hypothetical protein J2Y81_006122 [Paraburkholderia sediminicola]|nr:hypothetical protein [Paraburkholderia sediminicola]